MVAGADFYFFAAAFAAGSVHGIICAGAVYIYPLLIFRRGSMSNSRFSIRFRIIVSAATLLLFILLSETAVRLVGVDTYFQNRLFTLNRALDYPDVFKKDNRLFWRFWPDCEITSQFFEGRTYRINSLGMRGGEISERKTKNRILLLGNSCTFGWGRSDEETFAFRLGELLNGEYEIINGGIPGYSSFQGRRFFEDELAELKPDIVIFMFGWNDQWAAASEIPDKDQEFPPAIILKCQNFLSRLHSYRLLKKFWLNILEDGDKAAFDIQFPVYRVGFADFRANITAISETARQYGAWPVIMTQPAPSLTGQSKSVSWGPAVRYHEHYNSTVRELSGSKGIALVDAAREIEKHRGAYDNPRRDFIHFNAEGHKLIAQLLAVFIREHNAQDSP